MNLTPIVLYNNTSSASPAPFQQMLIIPANTSINSTYTNIRFRDGNYKLLTSWLESYTTSSATIWIVLPNGISSKSAMTIYMETGNLSDNFLDGVTVGEAPQLSGTYGQYDNGAKVFPVYFNGDTPTSDFSINSALSLTQTTATFSNGKIINVLKYETISVPSSIAALVYIGSSVGGGYWIAESSFASDGSSTDFGVCGLGQNSGSGTSDNLIQVDTQYGGSYFSESYVSSSTLTHDQNQAGSTTTAWRYGAVYDSSSTSFYGYIAPQLYSTSGGYSGTVLVNPVSSISSLYFAVNPVEGAPGYWIEFNWARVRAYPPNGTMPIQVNELSSTVNITEGLII